MSASEPKSQPSVGAKNVVEITFHGAHNLPVGDLHVLTSDPYINVELHVGDKDNDDGVVQFRTPTVRRTRDPVWTKTPPTSEEAAKNPNENPDESSGAKEESVGKASESDANMKLPSLCQWRVGGLPDREIMLVMHLKDEDPGTHDDALGTAYATFNPVREKAKLEERYKVRKRRGNVAVYLQTYIAAINPRRRLSKHANVIVSFRLIGKDENPSTRPYTIGPNRWSQHFSPLIGMITPARHARVDNATDKDNTEQANGDANAASSSESSLNLSSSTFIGNKIQLTGPVPSELRHDYVEFANFVKGLFTSKGVRGMILNRAMHKQYRTIYSYDKATRYGVVGVGFGGEGVAKDEVAGEDGEGKLARGNEDLSEAFAKQFLRMAGFGEGGRLFTYVITLDGEWRFTETGEEFAVDMISKHTMHANVTKTIAFSGEFFVRGVVKEEGGGFASAIKVENGTIANDDKEESEKSDEQKQQDKELEGKEGTDKKGDDHADWEEEKPSKIPQDPKLYELVIDNDSGTYRPKRTLLPIFREWLCHPSRLGGLGRVTVVDGFDEGLVKVKKHRAEVRKRGKGLATDEEKNAGGAPNGPIGKVKAKVDKVEEKVGEALGKDMTSKKAGPDGGRMVMAKKGSDSSLSSIGSGVLKQRSGSISSDKVEAVLAAASQNGAANMGGPGESSGAGKVENGDAQHAE